MPQAGGTRGPDGRMQVQQGTPHVACTCSNVWWFVWLVPWTPPCSLKTQAQYKSDDHLTGEEYTAHCGEERQ